MKKKLFLFTAVFLLAAAALYYVGILAPIITGYAAKNLASGIFTAGRTQESLEDEDLNFSFIKFNKNKVDYDKKEVESRFLFWKSKAVYIEGFGCTLVKDFDEQEIKSRPYPVIPLPDTDPDFIDWPAGDRLADTIPEGIDMDKLNRALDAVFADTLPMKGTFAVAAAYKNQLVAERHRNDLSAENLFLSWSMAKSFVNTFAGILVSQGKLSLDEPVKLDAWQHDERRDITLRNLLNMNSGLDWNEDYGSNSDVNKMLFKNGDMALFAADKKLQAVPGSAWYYSSGTTNIVCRLIRECIGNDADYYAFPRQELFNKMGMRSVVFETDASGNFAGSSYLYASMRDYVRYGLLYLNRGRLPGGQLLPEEWVDFTTTPAAGSEGGYGAFFWLNAGGAYPDAPADLYCSRGHDGQYIFIIPSRKLVIVRTGFSQKGIFDPNVFLRNILDALE